MRTDIIINEYYLIDTIDDTVLGPYESIDDYNNICKSLNIDDLGEWIVTKDLKSYWVAAKDNVKQNCKWRWS